LSRRPGNLDQGEQHLVDGPVIHDAVHIGAAYSDGRRRAAEYILRSPFSREKRRYQPKTGTVIDLSKMHPVLKRHFEVVSACDWLAALTAHLPHAGEHLVRYSGWSSTVNRGSAGRRREEISQLSRKAIRSLAPRPSAPGRG
jgi:hypothetical protein